MTEYSGCDEKTAVRKVATNEELALVVTSGHNTQRERLQRDGSKELRATLSSGAFAKKDSVKHQSRAVSIIV